MIRRKFSKSKRNFATELVDVDQFEYGIIRGFIDLVYSTGETNLGKIQAGDQSLTFKAVGDEYFLGYDFEGKLWEAVDKGVEELLKEGSENFIQEYDVDEAYLIKDLLSNYLENKYEVKVIDSFVGVSLEDLVKSATYLNIPTGIVIKQNHLSDKFWEVYEEEIEKGSSEQKATYIATTKTMTAKEVFHTFDVDLYDLTGLGNALKVANGFAHVPVNDSLVSDDSSFKIPYIDCYGDKCYEDFDDDMELKKFLRKDISYLNIEDSTACWLRDSNLMTEYEKLQDPKAQAKTTYRNKLDKLSDKLFTYLKDKEIKNKNLAITCCPFIEDGDGFVERVEHLCNYSKMDEYPALSTMYLPSYLCAYYEICDELNQESIVDEIDLNPELLF